MSHVSLKQYLELIGLIWLGCLGQLYAIVVAVLLHSTAPFLLTSRYESSEDCVSSCWNLEVEIPA